jgi:sigma-B regulation protein RsbU (phosphoserine phosphatase)
VPGAPAAREIAPACGSRGETMQESWIRQRDIPIEVLIVEDDELQAEYVSCHLELAGCSVRTVGDGLVALDMLAEHPVELLVVDWQLPGIDGIELTRRARELRKAGTFLHIVMMTASGEAETIRNALESGVDDFLYKPFEPIQLELAISSARRNLRLHRRLQRRNRMLSEAHSSVREALREVRADLEAAAAMHRRLLPAPGRYGYLDVSTIYQPAAQLGGDTIGVCEFNDGGLLFFLVDVRGHGVPAALESFHIHHRLKGLAPANPVALGRAAANLNREIAEETGDSYATLICGVIHPEAQRGWMVRAGHPPALLAGENGIELLEEGGTFPLGWFAKTGFSAVQFPFEPGAAIIVHSDGLSDVDVGSGRQFGIDPLREVLAGRSGRPVAAAVAGLDRELAALTGPEGAEDDISLLAIEFRG